MNLRLSNNEERSSVLTRAIEKRKSAGVGEPLSDAFTRILTMKNSEPDVRRIKAVEKAMNDGLVGREKKRWKTARS